MATSNASAAGGSATLSFTYDALGRRVSKSDGTTTTVYVSAGQQVVTEYHAGDNPASVAPQQSYVYGTYVDEPLAKIDATHGTLYYHTNRLYCVTALTDSSGAVVERYAYTAYGNTTILDPTATTVRATSSVGNSYMYTGRRLDPEFASTIADAIYYYRARYYDPQQGRFIGRDPLEYVDGMSMYMYVNDRPISSFDFTGNASLSPGTVVSGGIALFLWIQNHLNKLHVTTAVVDSTNCPTGQPVLVAQVDDEHYWEFTVHTFIGDVKIVTAWVKVFHSEYWACCPFCSAAGEIFGTSTSEVVSDTGWDVYYSKTTITKYGQATEIKRKKTVLRNCKYGTLTAGQRQTPTRQGPDQ